MSVSFIYSSYRTFN